MKQITYELTITDTGDDNHNLRLVLERNWPMTLKRS